ncbi:MAG: hypothetical protein LBU42_07470 [Prevotellaceae bacterium]|jgi:hypothetical protein|nr:hypothetical protein [Prevotellaceae bacterium]
MKFSLSIFKNLFSKRTGVFFIFVLIASFVWLMNRLSNEYRANLQLTVCVYSSTNEKTPHLCSDGILPITARTSGFNILKQRLSNPPVEVIDLKNQPVRRTTSNRYYLLVNDIKQLLNDEMHIEFFAKDTLFFTGISVDEFLENINNQKLND